jgi:hypothetical protein
MRTISHTTRNIVLAALSAAAVALVLAQWLPSALADNPPPVMSVDTQLTRCAEAGTERLLPCQRVVVSVDDRLPLLTFRSLARTGAPCGELAGELGQRHWVVDHRLPPYHPELASCDGAFTTAVIDAVLASGVRLAAVEQLVGWCPQGDDSCQDLVIGALTAKPAARAWFCLLVGRDDPATCVAPALPEFLLDAAGRPRAGSRLGSR